MMIEIAIPPILRRDPTIRRMLSDVKSGKPEARERLYTRLLEDIPDPVARQMLSENRAGMPDAKVRLRLYLEQGVSRLVQQYLHPLHDRAPTTVAAYEATEAWAKHMEVVRR